jgi:hypothetical protein
MENMLPFALKSDFVVAVAVHACMHFGLCMQWGKGNHSEEIEAVHSDLFIELKLHI